MTASVPLDAAAQAPRLGEGGADPAREAPLRVLCIEDNPVNLLLVKELFTLRPGVRAR